MMFYVMSYFVIAQAFNTTMVVGIFRSGGDKLRKRGFRVESLARIADMDCENGEITFA